MENQSQNQDGPTPTPVIHLDVAAVTAEIAATTRAHRLKRLREDLTSLGIREIDDLRKELELPPEALALMIERYETAGDASLASRQVLPMNTGGKAILPDQTAQITARPQRVAFRPERVFVSNATPEYRGPWYKRLWPWYQAPQTYGAADFLINDIMIGNRSQFVQAGDLPGDMFATGVIDSFVTFETAQVAMDVVMVVTYKGPIPQGVPFYGSIIGTAAV